MILLGLLAFLHLPLLIHSYRAHLSDALKLKCDALPYRTSYSEYRCYFAVLRKIEYSKSTKECSSIFAGAKTVVDVPAQAFSAMMLNKQDFHTDSAATGSKYTICVVEVDYQCESDSYMLSSGRCVTRAAKKMNYEDAGNYCQNLGMTLPSPANDRDNLIVRDALWKDPSWVQRFAVKENAFKWKQGNDYSMWSTCDRPGGYNPRLYAASQNSLWSCAKNTASVVDKSGYWSNAGTDYLMDVVCMKPATNAFSSVPSPCNYYDMTVSMGIAKNPVVRMRTCYASTLTKTRFQVIDRVTVETQRGCEVACDNHSACAAFVFKDAGFNSPCTLLAELSTNEDCAVPSNVFLKKTTGCVARSNISAEYGFDPCVDRVFAAAVGGPICPQIPDPALAYVVRAVTSNGTRITLDNDIVNKLTPENGMWTFSYVWDHYSYSLPVVAAACVYAGADKCGCSPVPLLPVANAVPVRTEVNGACAEPSHKLYFSFFHCSNEASCSTIGSVGTVGAVRVPCIRVECKAGEWMLWPCGPNSLRVTGLACAP